MADLTISHDSSPARFAGAGRRLPGAWDIIGEPLPDLGIGDRLLLRVMALAARAQVRAVTGLEHVMPDRDPFILVFNHSSRLEALLVPALLIHARGGRHIHFLADWNFRLIPGINLLYRRSRAITVLRKPARPRFLNALKPLYRDAVPPAEQARRKLLAGGSLGIFPEGTVNRDPAQLLRGRLGAARLALETGVPVVPAGLRFPAVPRGAPVPEGSPMHIEFGEPLQPATAVGSGAHALLQSFHAEIMTAIADLSGKCWRYGLSTGEKP